MAIEEKCTVCGCELISAEPVCKECFENIKRE